MDNETMLLLAQKITNNNKIIVNKQNSILNLLDMSNGSTDEDNTIIAKMAAMVNNEVSIFRNEYIPFMRQYKDTVNGLLAGKTGIIDTTRWNIVPVSIPQIVNQFIAKGIINVNSSVIELNTSDLSLNNPGSDIIRSYLKLESPTMDTYMDELLVGVSDEYLINVWDKYLLNISGSNENISELVYKSGTDINEITILFVLLYNLKKRVPESVRISEVNYLKIMRDAFNKVASDIGYVVKNYNAIESMGRLVINIKNNTIYVVKSLYNEFLKNNSIESLLGILFMDDTSTKNFYLKDVIENAPIYATKWENKLKQLKMISASDDISKYRFAYEMAIELIYKEMSTVVSEVITIDSNTGKKVVNEYVRTLSPTEIADVNTVSNFITINLFLNNTNLSTFIDNMDKYAKMDVNITSKEAASLASLDLIMDYLFSQITLEG